VGDERLLDQELIP